MRYFIGFLVTIGLIIILIILLLSGGGSNNSKKPQNTKALSDYATSDAVARLTIDGPINAEQNHRAVVISVSQDDVTYQEVHGYQGSVANQQSYVNNTEAYSNFLYAIGHAGFNLGDNSKELANEKGYCANGSRYVFELLDQGKTVERYWATSCSKPKTYKGNLNLTLDLFKAQVPNYNDLTNNVDLGSGFSI